MKTFDFWLPEARAFNSKVGSPTANFAIFDFGILDWKLRISKLGFRILDISSGNLYFEFWGVEFRILNSEFRNSNFQILFINVLFVSSTRRFERHEWNTVQKNSRLDYPCQASSHEKMIWRGVQCDWQRRNRKPSESGIDRTRVGAACCFHGNKYFLIWAKNASYSVSGTIFPSCCSGSHWPGHMQSGCRLPALYSNVLFFNHQ